jgi:hypothetical protein
MCEFPEIADAKKLPEKSGWPSASVIAKKLASIDENYECVLRREGGGDP